MVQAQYSGDTKTRLSEDVTNIMSGTSKKNYLFVGRKILEIFVDDQGVIQEVIYKQEPGSKIKRHKAYIQLRENICSHLDSL